MCKQSAHNKTTNIRYGYKTNRKMSKKSGDDDGGNLR